VIAHPRPIDAAEFSRLMAVVGPFESDPAIAVGVSGGADSLALCLLAAEWTAAAGGRLTALVVDHRLRPGSAKEAARVRGWLGGRGIACVVLGWPGPKPATGIEAAARDARYRLLLRWCRDNRVLHLLVAHHVRDQAETVLMRLSRGSGFEGLAAMRPISEALDVRILRPLLAIAPERLKATLDARRQEWIEDPMNADPAYARVRWRAAQPVLAAAGISTELLGGVAEQAGAVRAALDAAVAAVLVRGCRLHPAGFARLSAASLREAPAEIAWRALARVAACIGGRPRPPPRATAVRLLHRIEGLASPGIGTLARCRLIAEGDDIVVCRERRGLPEPVAVSPGQRLHWDGRFIVEIGVATRMMGGRGWLRPLPADAWRALKAAGQAQQNRAWPVEAATALPALFDEDGLVAVPHLDYLRGDEQAGRCAAVINATFAPSCPMTGMGYFLGMSV
jgi:tRNA(Ile)-lysidine synthase